MASVVQWQVCAFHTGWRKSNPETRSSATHSERSRLFALSCSDSSHRRFWHHGLQVSPRDAMPETQLTDSSSSCLLVVGIQLSAATCCSGVYTLRLLSKWEKEVALAYEPSGTHAPRTVTSVPKGTDFFLMNRSTPKNDTTLWPPGPTLIHCWRYWESDTLKSAYFIFSATACNTISTKGKFLLPLNRTLQVWLQRNNMEFLWG